MERNSLIGITEIARMLGKRTSNVRPDELRDFPKPVIERPFPKWRRWEVERYISPSTGEHVRPKAAAQPAANETPALGDLRVTDDQASLARSRYEIALEAVEELESLAGLVSAEAEKMGLNGYAIRGLSFRMQDLAGIAGAALSDDDHGTRDLEKKLRRST